jgi:hypothetical protein
MSDPYEQQELLSGANARQFNDSALNAHAAEAQPKGDDMNTLAFDAQTIERQEAISKRIRAKFQVAGVVGGLAGGVGAGISGGLLTVASWLAVNEGARHWLSTAGSVLLLLTIPLIILGAYCLDWMEKGRPQHRGARYDDEDEE